MKKHVANPNIIPILIYRKMFSTGDLVYKMLNTFDIQELSGTITTYGRTLPGNFQKTVNFQ